MVLLYVGSAAAGLAVLGVCAVRVHAEVRAFGRQIRHTRARLTAGRGRPEMRE